MNKKTARRKRDLKTKLLAAVAMLLVSSLMMVTTTYAWFTLSTAPEVTGITTAVGANGNLEMALLPYDALSAHTAADDYGITSAAGDGVLPTVQKNTTWGNLVDVSDTTIYGMNNIVLYPAELNLTDSKVPVGNAAAPLKTPVYGADGRINELKANTITGVYDGTNAQFAESITIAGTTPTTITNATGVRAIGTSSSLTARELAHRNAVAAALSEKGGANTDAGRTLNKNGSAISDIAIKRALLGKATFTWTEIQALYQAVLDMDAIAGRIEKAMINYLLAYNIAPDTAESTYAELVSAFNSVTTLAAAEALKGAEVEGTPTWTVSVPSEGTAYATAKDALTTLRSDITEAKTLLEAERDETDITWTRLSTALGGLVDMDLIRVGTPNSAGYTMDELNDPLYGGKEEAEEDEEGNTVYPARNALVQDLLDKGTTVAINMPNGSGVFTNIANFIGNYSGSFKTELTYNGLPMSIQTVMTAQGAKDYLSTVASMNGMTFVSATGGSSSNPISTFYGYIIDLAFRTNAANSYLQLQADAIDRIYEDGSNESTMGHGASMTFKTDSETFGQAGVKSLMESIRIVFFDTVTGEIYANAQLDADAAETNATSGEVKMPIVLLDADGEVTTETKIMDLNQNQAHVLSVLVYLDGNTVTNADVATDFAQSMAGSMNLQFSSSAQLKPMEYNDLRNGTSSVTPSTPEAITMSAVGLAEGTDASISLGTALGTNGTGVAVVISGVPAGATVTASINSSAAITGVEQTVNGTSGYFFAYTDELTATTPIEITVNPAT